MHQRALRLVYKDNNELTFNDLWELDNSVTTHKRNFQILATDIFEVKNSFAGFEIKEPHYNLRSGASQFNPLQTDVLLICTL